MLTFEFCFLAVRFIGNLDLCGRQVHKPCRTSMGFPVVLPHAASDEAEGKFLSTLVHFWDCRL